MCLKVAYTQINYPEVFHFLLLNLSSCLVRQLVLSLNNLKVICVHSRTMTITFNLTYQLI